MALKSGEQGIRGRPSCFSALHLYQDALKGADFDGLGEVSGHARVKAPMNALNRYLSIQPKNQLRVNCDDDSTLLSMVAQRLGVTAMPELCLQNPSENVC